MQNYARLQCSAKATNSVFIEFRSTARDAYKNQRVKLEEPVSALTYSIESRKIFAQFIYVTIFKSKGTSHRELK